jgi:hypothetical protein
MRGGAIAAVLVAAALVLSGCQYLLGPLVGGPIYPVDPGDFGSFDPGEFGSFDPNEPGFSIPPPAATYKTGSATVTIGDSVMTLDRLAAPGSLMTDYGGNAVFTDGAGNYLQVYGAQGGASAFPLEPAFLTIERIADGRHLTASDPAGCKVTIATADATGFAGSASCKALRWSDALAPFDPIGRPSYVEGEPAFDAEVEFSAKP